MRKSVHIKLKAKHPGVVERDGIVEVSVSTAPVDGKANEEMLELLSDYFEVAKSAIEIVSGHTSRNKIIEIRTWQKR
jgi:uncharacterized protein